MYVRYYYTVQGTHTEVFSTGQNTESCTCKYLHDIPISSAGCQLVTSVLAKCRLANLLPREYTGVRPANKSAESWTKCQQMIGLAFLIGYYQLGTG